MPEEEGLVFNLFNLFPITFTPYVLDFIRYNIAHGKAHPKTSDKERVDSLYDFAKMSLGGWDRSYLLKPQKAIDWWYYCYRPHPGSVTARRCSAKLEGPVRALLGPGPLLTFGLDQNNRKIILEAQGPTSRSVKSPWPLI